MEVVGYIVLMALVLIGEGVFLIGTLNAIDKKHRNKSE